MNDPFTIAAVGMASGVIVYAVASGVDWLMRRRSRRAPAGEAGRERELLDRIKVLEEAIIVERANTDYWRNSSSRHSQLAGESLQIISDLKRENEAMARKPLTEDQLKECLESGGTACPRCGDEDELKAGDLESDDDEGGIYYQDVECSGCNENFRLVFTLTKVEPIED